MEIAPTDDTKGSETVRKWTNVYVVRPVRLSTGEHLPLLIDRRTRLPDTSVLSYTLTALRGPGLSPSTINTHLSGIAVGLSFLRHRGICMLSRVSRGDFLLRDELASFADRCLQRDDGLGSVVTTYAQTRYVSFIRFIEWLAEPVLLRMKSMERRSLKADLLSFTRRAEAQKPSGHSGIDPVERLGLLPSQRALLLEVIDPKSPKNPFQKKLRVRNHAMILFCYTYGVRAGELLGLRRSDYKDGRLPKTMSIHRRPHDEHDRRPVPVRAKTRARMLEIDGPAGLALDAWVTERMDRSKFPNARKNAFLFVNSRGDEISLRGARLVFERLRDFYPELGCFSQHVLRHDVNERLVEETAAHGWEPAEVRQDAIYLMGWSENSKMPDVYARRAISQRANERIAKLQEKDHST